MIIRFSVQKKKYGMKTVESNIGINSVEKVMRKEEKNVRKKRATAPPEFVPKKLREVKIILKKNFFLISRQRRAYDLFPYLLFI